MVYMYIDTEAQQQKDETERRKKRRKGDGGRKSKKLTSHRAMVTGYEKPIVVFFFSGSRSGCGRKLGFLLRYSGYLALGIRVSGCGCCFLYFVFGHFPPIHSLT